MVIDPGLLKGHIAQIGQVLSRHIDCDRRIDAVQTSYFWRYPTRPTTASAAHIESFGVGSQVCPRENNEIVLKRFLRDRAMPGCRVMRPAFSSHSTI